MFQLLEIVGISDISHSDAVKNGIDKITEAGEKVFWFEVSEQRGAIKQGKIQYQVKLKIAVAIEKDGEEPTYICPSCGRTSENPDTLCSAKRTS